MRTNYRGRWVVVGDRRVARTHAQPGGSGAGSVCVAGVCPGAAERSGTREHAQVGPAGAGQEPSGCCCACATPTPRLTLSQAAAPAARAPLGRRRRSSPAGHGSLCTSAGTAESSGPPGRCLGPGRFVRRRRRKARPSGSGSTRRHFLARSRHRLARSLPPDWD